MTKCQFVYNVFSLAKQVHRTQSVSLASMSSTPGIMYFHAEQAGTPAPKIGTAIFTILFVLHSLCRPSIRICCATDKVDSGSQKLKSQEICLAFQISEVKFSFLFPQCRVYAEFLFVGFDGCFIHSLGQFPSRSFTTCFALYQEKGPSSSHAAVAFKTTFKNIN